MCIGRVLIAVATAASLEAQSLPRAIPDSVGLSSVRLRQLRPALQAYVDSGKLAGVVVAVARHGKLAYLDTIGPSMRSDAVFRIYSMTKPIATVAVMQLIERGKLRVNDPLSNYIPAFANVQVYDGGGALHPRLRRPDRPITIADLLTHTAGLTYGAFGETPVDSIYRRRIGRLDASGRPILPANWTVAQLADSIARLPLLFSPGTAWNYSFAIDILGRVVEIASGKRFDHYLADEIFAPLGMQSTAFHETPAMRGRITTMYTRGPNGRLVPDPYRLAPEFRADEKIFLGGSGLLSTVSDYLRFTQMLLNGGTFGGHRVLTRASVDAMFENHIASRLIPLPMDGWPPGINGFGYGGAVRVDTVPKAPGGIGTLQWAGYGATFFWVDRPNDLAGMVWAQFIPGPFLNAMDNEVQRLVYAALQRQQTSATGSR